MSEHATLLGLIASLDPAGEVAKVARALLSSGPILDMGYEPSLPRVRNGQRIPRKLKKRMKRAGVWWLHRGAWYKGRLFGHSADSITIDDVVGWSSPPLTTVSWRRYDSSP